jgi:hypothetical protein
MAGPVVPVPDAAAAVGKPGADIAWAPCPKDTGFLCGSLQVPLSYRHPSGGSVRLAVIERPVPDSQGVVVFTPGEPGESGVLILPSWRPWSPRR